MLPLPVHGEACSLPTRTFGAVRSSDPNSGPVSQGGGGTWQHHTLQIGKRRPREGWILSKVTDAEQGREPRSLGSSAVPVQYSKLLPGTLQIKTIMLLLKYLLA